MNQLFKPAITLMNKLNYRNKFILLGSIVVIVLGVLTYQLVNQSLSIIRFSQKEMIGVEYINPVIKLMHSVQNYQQLSTNILLNDQAAKDKSIELRDSIDNIILSIDTHHDSKNTELGTSQDWNAVKNKWQSIKNNEQTTPTTLENMTILVASIQKLIVTACDNSNLTLDPDIDTYYLMTSYCTAIPDFIEEATILRETGKMALFEKQLSELNSQKMIINKTLMDKLNKVSIKNNFDKILKVRPLFINSVQPLIESLALQSTQLASMINTTILAKDFTVSSITYDNQFTKLINTAYQLYTETAKNLNQLLGERVNSFYKALYTNLLMVSICLIILMYLFAGISLSILNSIRHLIKGSEKFANGDLETKVALESNDELLQVSASFNVMRDKISKLANEIHLLIRSEMEGDLTKRIELNDKHGYFKELSISINQLSDVFQQLIQEATLVLDNIAKGNLTQKMTKDYKGTFGEFKVYLNQSADSLENLIKGIKNATQNINHAAEEIALGNNDLAKRTEQQAAFLEETATSIEGFTVTVKENAEHAKQANLLAQSASGVATKGREVVNEVVATMTIINDSSQKVADIISVIDNIAFQTNILALNAAVEAARAGEQGRGFAVVASEVRSLAQRTSSAAKEINLLISKSVENVTSGNKLVDTAGLTMEEIVKAVNRVTEIMAEIASASMEQSNGIEQVNQAIIQMDKVTQQNTQLVEEAATAAKSMEQQTENLEILVSTFKLSHDQSDSVEPYASESLPSPLPEIQKEKRFEQNKKNPIWDKF